MKDLSKDIVSLFLLVTVLLFSSCSKKENKFKIESSGYLTKELKQFDEVYSKQYGQFWLSSFNPTDKKLELSFGRDDDYKKIISIDSIEDFDAYELFPFERGYAFLLQEEFYNIERLNTKSITSIDSIGNKQFSIKTSYFNNLFKQKYSNKYGYGVTHGFNQNTNNQEAILFSTNKVLDTISLKGYNYVSDIFLGKSQSIWIFDSENFTYLSTNGSHIRNTISNNILTLGQHFEFQIVGNCLVFTHGFENQGLYILYPNGKFENLFANKNIQVLTDKKRESFWVSEQADTIVSNKAFNDKLHFFLFENDTIINSKSIESGLNINRIYRGSSPSELWIATNSKSGIVKGGDNQYSHNKLYSLDNGEIELIDDTVLHKKEDFEALFPIGPTKAVSTYSNNDTYIINKKDKSIFKIQHDIYPKDSISSTEGGYYYDSIAFDKISDSVLSLNNINGFSFFNFNGDTLNKISFGINNTLKNNYLYSNFINDADKYGEDSNIKNYYINETMDFGIINIHNKVNNTWSLYSLNQLDTEINNINEKSFEFSINNFDSLPNPIEFKYGIYRNGDKIGGNSDSLEAFKIGDNLFKVNYAFYNDEKIESDKAYDFYLTLSTKESKAFVSIKDKMFTKPFFKANEGKTILLLLGLLLLSILIIKLNLLPSIVKRYSPLIVFVTSGFFTSYGDGLIEEFSKHFDSTTFILGSITLLVASVFSGFISPYMYRQLQSVTPFDLLNSFLKTIPAFKKRYFKEHIESINFDKEVNSVNDIKDESYVPIPARFRINGNASIESAPVDKLLELTTNAKHREAPHILIKAPGGQGKSALLRAFVKAYIIKYNNDTALPIPIYVSGEQLENESVESIIKNALGSLVVEDSFKKELSSGSFILFFDGLSEAGIPKGVFETFVKASNDIGRNTCVIATIRPNKKIETEFKTSKNYILIEPQRLNDNNVEIFVNSYLNPDKRLNRELLDICKDEAGDYLPILVRLAVNLVNKSYKSNISKSYSINTLYKDFVESMTKTENGVIDSNLISLSFETYFNKGKRNIYINDSNKEKVEFGINSGLLVSVANERFEDVKTRQYRFLHDTIHTFLVSLSIYEKYENGEEGFKKLEALFYDLATQDYYREDSSSLFIREGSEIYQMSVLEFEAKEVSDLPTFFQKDLKLKWQEYKDFISVNSIKQIVPVKLKDRFKFKANSPEDMHLEILEEIKDDYLLISEYFHNFSVLIDSLDGESFGR
ncbi:hypothetical protein [Flavivirga spongiicola]|uniref:NACHT domain-containing protein n=1 Tax=Flavivirga spongiicola TaxID=421621 RepID=A0ABU7XRQ5_9FLAO|nr:hypothetical protein [Flavivirga sp. MEBiC05379]MDO5978255.1 hypothetical protein [Flavivirga sp. MEBiC05379]